MILPNSGCIVLLSTLIFPGPGRCLLRDETPTRTAAVKLIQEAPGHPWTIVTDRIRITVPKRPALLGIPFRIDVTLAPGATPNSLWMVQLDPHDDPRPNEAPFAAAFRDLDRNEQSGRVITRTGNSASIEFKPAALGHIDILVSQEYPKNTMARQIVRLDVQPTSLGLESFALMGEKMAIIRMEVSGVLNHQHTDPEITMKGSTYPIHIGSTKSLLVKVDQDTSHPVLAISDDGQITALAVGHATLTAKYQGLVDIVRVEVSTEVRHEAH